MATQNPGLALIATTGFVIAGLIVTRPHVERYYAELGCTSLPFDKQCWNEDPVDYRHWTVVNEFPDYRSCKKAQDEDQRHDDEARHFKAIVICEERHRLEWGYRD